MIINNKHFVINITMNGKPVENTKSERDFGICLCSNLKWSYQASITTKKAKIIYFAFLAPL